MTTLLQITTNFSAFTTPYGGSSKKESCFGLKLSHPVSCYTISGTKTASFHELRLKLGLYGERSLFLGVRGDKDWLFVQGWHWKKRVGVVRFNQGFGFNGGGGGGGGRDNSNTARVLGNLVLAIGLTYLSMTGQLGWVLDAIVSVWLLAVLLPILGLGAFLWWAGRDIVQGSCPNCGNDFQIFKSTLNDDLQFCPFCSQPFSVVGDKFVQDPVKFSNQSTTFGQAFNDFSGRSKEGISRKDSSTAVVDVEAEIKDAD